MEANQIDILAFAVLRYFKQIEDAEETGFQRQLWSDVRKTYRCDRIHFDLAFVHRIPAADFDVGTRPDSNAASYFSATNPLAQTLGEDHEGESTPR